MDDDLFFAALRPSTSSVLCKPTPSMASPSTAGLASPCPSTTSPGSSPPRAELNPPTPLHKKLEPPTLVASTLRSKSSVLPLPQCHQSNDMMPSPHSIIDESAFKPASLPTRLSRFFSRASTDNIQYAKIGAGEDDDSLSLDGQASSEGSFFEPRAPTDPKAIAEAEELTRLAIMELGYSGDRQALSLSAKAINIAPYFLPALVVWRCVYGSCPNRVGPAKDREAISVRLFLRIQSATQRDKEEAIKFLRSCPGKQIARLLEGMLHMIVKCARDPVAATQCYTEASDSGNAIAMCSLATQFAEGTGCRKDPQAAMVLYEHASSVGIAFAQFSLGIYYEKGTVVRKDVEEAAKLYRAAADQGLAIAQYHYARMLLTGLGVPKNDAEAKKLFKASAEQGYVFALRLVKEHNL